MRVCVKNTYAGIKIKGTAKITNLLYHIIILPDGGLHDGPVIQVISQGHDLS
jgi:hypothetical protein